MTEQPDDRDEAAGHGAYGGTARDDSGLQEDPAGSPEDVEDDADWAEKTETGGQAAS